MLTRSAVRARVRVDLRGGGTTASAAAQPPQRLAPDGCRYPQGEAREAFICAGAAHQRRNTCFATCTRTDTQASERTRPNAARGGATGSGSVRSTCPVSDSVVTGCRYPSGTRWRRRVNPARLCIWRAIRLVLVSTPSVGPLLYGSVNAAITASRSRSSPRAKAWRCGRSTARARAIQSSSVSAFSGWRYKS